ncbi:MAG: hypothetical protein AB1512_19325 [Thermodesulfobacteriota bacterium]
MKAITAIAVIWMLFSGTCFAHEDRIITVKDDGSLMGIPSAYGPAILHVEFAPPELGSAPITSITLHLGNNHVRIPICVTGLLRSQNLSEIRASASWYHDEKIVPYYLHLVFYDPGYDKSRWANSGFSLTFNLHTGKLMKMQVIIVRDNGKSMQSVPVDIAARCNSEELRGLVSDTR